MPKKKTNEATIADGSELNAILRTMVDESGVSRYAIAEATGITEAALSRQYNGKATTTLATLARVAESIGYRVVVRVEKTETE